MATYTPNLNLKKPDYTDLADVADFNANMDIIDGLTQDDIPDGTTNKAFTATEKDKLAGIEPGANKTTIAVHTATLTTTWEGTSAPYTQDITVVGITSSDTPIISPVYSTDNATAILEKEAWNMIGKAITGTDTITFTCFEEKPVTAIPIQIKVVR
jgi:hypothetical protein